MALFGSARDASLLRSVNRELINRYIDTEVWLYKLDLKSEVAPIDEAEVKKFAETSHKLGLNNKQAQGILEYYKSIMESSDQQTKIDIETSRAESEQQLRQEWGKAFDNNVEKAKSLAKANLGVDVLEMQLKTGIKLGDHPDIVKGFAKIADMMSEDKIVSTESENVDQGKDIEQEISKIMNDRTGAKFPFMIDQPGDNFSSAIDRTGANFSFIIDTNEGNF